MYLVQFPLRPRARTITTTRSPPEERRPVRRTRKIIAATNGIAVGDGFLRLPIGLETRIDLLNDLAQALAI
jgi:cystathionine beta-lyase/cystathionine gamma-synthase